jgi:hypothetical protein
MGIAIMITIAMFAGVCLLIAFMPRIVDRWMRRRAKNQHPRA